MAAGDSDVRRPYAARMPAQERRAHLLDVTRGLVAERGADAVTVDAVAKAAGVTRPVVYTHFADAEDLLASLLEREGAWALERILELVPADLGEADPVATFVEIAEGYLRAVAEHPDRWRPILLPADGTPHAVQVFKREADELIEARLVENLRWFAGGAPAPGVDLPLLARMLMVMMEESGRLVLAEPERYPTERLAGLSRFVLTMLHAGLTGPAAP